VISYLREMVLRKTVPTVWVMVLDNSGKTDKVGVIMSLRPPLPRPTGIAPKPLGAPKAGPFLKGKPPIGSGTPGRPSTPGAPKKPC